MDRTGAALLFMILAVVAWPPDLEQKPEDANLPAAAIVLITLHDSFPCDA